MHTQGAWVPVPRRFCSCSRGVWITHQRMWISYGKTLVLNSAIYFPKKAILGNTCMDRLSILYYRSRRQKGRGRAGAIETDSDNNSSTARLCGEKAGGARARLKNKPYRVISYRACCLLIRADRGRLLRPGPGRRAPAGLCSPAAGCRVPLAQCMPVPLASLRHRAALGRHGSCSRSPDR